jgi:hypothetical protein
MEKLLEKIVDFRLKHRAKDFSQHIMLSLLLDDVESELRSSPWKKFAGTIESFPCVVKYKNGVTRMYNSKISFDLTQKFPSWEINRYLPIPPIQDDI